MRVDGATWCRIDLQPSPTSTMTVPCVMRSAVAVSWMLALSTACACKSKVPVEPFAEPAPVVVESAPTPSSAAAATLPPIAELTPSALGGIYLGMPRAAFEAARPGAVFVPEKPGMPQFGPPTLDYVEKLDRDGMRQVDYQLKPGANARLIEFVITYSDPGGAEAAFASGYAGRVPNNPHAAESMIIINTYQPWVMVSTRSGSKLVLMVYGDAGE